jgi:hypothetical protein
VRAAWLNPCSETELAHQSERLVRSIEKSVRPVLAQVPIATLGSDDASDAGVALENRDRNGIAGPGAPDERMSKSKSGDSGSDDCDP